MGRYVSRPTGVRSGALMQHKPWRQWRYGWCLLQPSRGGHSSIANGNSVSSRGSGSARSVSLARYMLSRSLERVYITPGKAMRFSWAPSFSLHFHHLLQSIPRPSVLQEAFQTPSQWSTPMLSPVRPCLPAWALPLPSRRLQEPYVIYYIW